MVREKNYQPVMSCLGPSPKSAEINQNQSEENGQSTFIVRKVS